jgi:hypothetical protein
MDMDRIHDLHHALGIVDEQIAHPYDLADLIDLKHLRAAIQQDAREILHKMNAAEPDWCQV